MGGWLGVGGIRGGWTIAKVWSELSVKAVDAMNLEEFFGFLTFKYKEDQQGARYPLNHIPGL